MNSKQDTSSVDPLAESASALEAAFGRDAENPAVCVVDGYGIQVATRSGRLIVQDGIGTHRRERIYSRANHGLSRLVIVGTTGHITIEAFRWLDERGWVRSSSIRVRVTSSQPRRASSMMMLACVTPKHSPRARRPASLFRNIS